MSVQVERSVFLGIACSAEGRYGAGSRNMQLPGTEVYAINEISTSYSFVRRAIPGRYLPVLPGVLTLTRSVFHTSIIIYNEHESRSRFVPEILQIYEFIVHVSMSSRT